MTAKTVSKPSLRLALAGLVQAVLNELKGEEITPRVVESPYPLSWVAQQQEVLVAVRPQVWIAPLSISQVDRLDRFPQMAEVRRVISEDNDLAGRVDTPVGAWFSMNDRRLGLLLFQELLDRYVVDTSSYDFDQARFDAHYLRLESGLLATEFRIVDYLPILGFESSFASTELPGGFLLARMTTPQLNEAILHGAVPIEKTLSFTSIQVSRFTHWAISSTHTHPLQYGPNPVQEEAPPNWTALEDAGHRLITSLRVVCGGSVAATRCLSSQHEDDFPVLNGASAHLSRVAQVDLERPAVLVPELVKPLRKVFVALSRTDVRGDRVLALALRRLVYAGIRSDPADRLLDLMIAAEALFLKHSDPKRPLKSRNVKGNPVAEEAAQLLKHDPQLKRESFPEADAYSAIHGLMKTCYNRRNAEMHGDADPALSTITLLDGTVTADAAVAILDLDRIMRLSLQRTLEKTVAEQQ